MSRASFLLFVIMDVAGEKTQLIPLNKYIIEICFNNFNNNLGLIICKLSQILLQGPLSFPLPVALYMGSLTPWNLLTFTCCYF